MENNNSTTLNNNSTILNDNINNINNNGTTSNNVVPFTDCISNIVSLLFGCWRTGHGGPVRLG